MNLLWLNSLAKLICLKKSLFKIFLTINQDELQKTYLKLLLT